LLLGAAGGRASTTYNLVQDWSSSNPNGPWAYYSGSTLLPYQPNEASLAGNPGFSPGNTYGVFLPLFWQDDGPGSDIYIHSVDPYNGQAATGDAVLTWTAPATGRIDISGYLYYAQTDLQRSNDYSLTLAGETLQSGTLSYLNANGPSNEVALSFGDLSVTMGESLDLTLAKSTGELAGTETGLNLIVTESGVPEPGIWALMLLGVAALGARLRGRLRKPATT
jgi:hypothetical protein